jgi:hypothetical protein
MICLLALDLDGIVVLRNRAPAFAKATVGKPNSEPRDDSR